MKKILFSIAKKAVALTSRQRAKVVTKVVAKEFLTHASVAKATEVMKDKFNELDKYLTQEKANMENFRQTFAQNQTEQPRISIKSLKWATANAYGKIKTFKIRGIYSEMRSKVTEFKDQAQSEFQETTQHSFTSRPKEAQFSSSGSQANDQKAQSNFTSQAQQQGLVENQGSASASRKPANSFNPFYVDYNPQQMKSSFENLLGKGKSSAPFFSNFKKRMFWKIAFFFGFLVFCYSFAKHLALSIGRNKSIEQFIKSQNVIREAQGLPPVTLQASQ